MKTKKILLTALAVMLTSVVFAQDLRWVKQYGKYGYRDAKGNIVIPCQFLYAMDFQYGAGIIETSDGLGLIDRKGNYLVKPQYKYHAGNANKFGKFAFTYGKNSEGKLLWCVYDSLGNQILPPMYIGVDIYKNGIKVETPDTLWGLVDNSGKFLIEPDKKYKALWYGNDDHTMIIDTNDNWFIGDKFGNILWTAPKGKRPWLDAGNVTNPKGWFLVGDIQKNENTEWYYFVNLHTGEKTETVSGSQSNFGENKVYPKDKRGPIILTEDRNIIDKYSKIEIMFAKSYIDTKRPYARVTSNGKTFYIDASLNEYETEEDLELFYITKYNHKLGEIEGGFTK